MKDINRRKFIKIALTSGMVMGSNFLLTGCNEISRQAENTLQELEEKFTNDLNVKYFIDRANATQSTQIQAAVENAIQTWVTWQRSKLGRDLNPSELNHRIIAAGAKRAEIISPVFRTVKYKELAIPSSQTITFGGLEDG